MAEHSNKDRPNRRPPSREQVTAMTPAERSRPPEPLQAHRPLPMGSMVGKYRVTAVLGHGGMGTVYAAEDSLIKRKVAIKVLSPQLAPDASVINRLLAEAQAAGKLNHPNVVTIYDVDRLEGTYYIVMELVSGGSVQDYLGRKGSPGWKAATRLVAEACKALIAAHDSGLIHRDIKPSNLMLTADGHVKVTDFGLAKLESGDTMLQTQPGAILGTPSFMSPEQCRGDKLDVRTDIYSLGCSYFALLTGKPPYEAASSIQVMFAHCSSPIPDPRELNADAPDACIEVLNKALAKDPSERYASARDMLADLRAVLGAATTTSPNPLEALAAGAEVQQQPAEPVWHPQTRGGRRPLLKWGIAGAAALFLVIAVIFMLTRYADEPKRAVAAPARNTPALPPAAPAPTATAENDKTARADRVPPSPLVIARVSPQTVPAPALPLPAPNDTPLENQVIATPSPSTAPSLSAPIVSKAPQAPLAPHITNSIGQKLTLIRPGKFFMGDNKLPDAPRHEATLTKPFYIGVHEVTTGEVAKVVGNDPRAAARREELPAALVSWEEASVFCRRLSNLPDEKAAGRVYRLPTEAEWEYACRATTTTKYAFGEILTPQQANFGRKIDLSAQRRGPGEDDAGPGNDAGRAPPPAAVERGRRGPLRGRRAGGPPREPVQREPIQRPLEPAGSFPANEWGLHDMHGSVWEWCGDFYSPKAYTTGSRVNPVGPESGKSHVARGGCWSSPAAQCASAHRNGQGQANSRMPAFGFRVVCEIRPPAGS